MSNNSSLIPPIGEVLDSRKSVDKSKLRYINTDNSWNKEGILSAFNEEEDQMYVCASTGIPLFYLDNNGRKYALESHGYCALSGELYHESQLRLSSDVSKSPYPIQYEGAVSLEEYSKPLSEEEIISIRNEYGI